MATPLHKDENIAVLYRELGTGYRMNTLEKAFDHYNLGYTIQGERRCITPTKSYAYGAGDISMISPYIYHKTIPQSDAPYKSFLIKFTYEFAEPFIEEYGSHVFTKMYETNIYHLNKENQRKVKNIFFDMLEIYNAKNDHYEFILRGLLFRIFEIVLQENILPTPNELYATHLSNNMIDAITYMENFYAENPSLAEVAHSVNLSPSYFSRLFRRQFGKTFSEYLNDIKMRHVLYLLSNTEQSVMEIALSTGYCHGNYLCEKFKTAVGISPREYRKQLRAGCTVKTLCNVP